MGQPLCLWTGHLATLGVHGKQGWESSSVEISGVQEPRIAWDGSGDQSVEPSHLKPGSQEKGDGPGSKAPVIQT